jgi:hypothetical protein
MPRTEEFEGGAESARASQFRTVQQSQGLRSYEKRSVLDNLMPSNNGMDKAGVERVRIGVNHSTVGQSDDTFDKGLWLRNAEQFGKSQYGFGDN